MNERKSRAWLIGYFLLCLCVTDTVWSSDNPQRPMSLIDAAEEASRSLARVLRGGTVVVLDPRPFDSGRTDLRRLGRALGTDLRLALDRQRGVTVLEKARLDEALRELRLNLSDLFDPQQRRRFGRFTGTRYVVLGELVEGPRSIEFIARAVRLETGELLRDVSLFLDKNPATYRLRGVTMPALIRLQAGGLAEVYVDGQRAGMTNTSGRLELQVNAGRHRIEVKRRGYLWQSVSVDVAAGQSVDLKLRLKPLPDPDTVGLMSMIIPGWGDAVLGHSDFWTYPLIFYGSLYGAKYYWDRRNELVEVEDPDTGRTKVEKSGKWRTYGLLALAAVVWVYDVAHVRASARVMRLRDAAYRPRSLTMSMQPGGDSMLLSLRWRF